ncbi:hypothetical protein G6F58_013410 [Rhizopus delemar]|nr:hypothetical protein G6F58_013410 [Rhizopus delemar]
MPAWRNAFIVADAMPARSAGTWAITAMPVAGTAKPMPMPSSIHARKYTAMAWAAASKAQPAAATTAPTGMTRWPPQRATARPASGDTSAIVTMAAEKPP